MGLNTKNDLYINSSTAKNELISPTHFMCEGVFLSEEIGINIS